MLPFVRRKLLFQLLSIYLLFVMVVLIGGGMVNAAIEQQQSNNVQLSDQALAQDIALETSIHVHDNETSLEELSALIVHAKTPQAVTGLFQTYKTARKDVDHLYWLDPFGLIQSSYPVSTIRTEREFSPPNIVQRARLATHPVFEVGIADETTFNAGIIVAAPARDAQGHLMGIVAASLSLVELSEPLQAVVQAQHLQERRLMISIIDERGELIATPEHARILQTVLRELPGANLALQGHTVSQVGKASDGQDWLFSAMPVPDIGWAVVVQRPADEALAVVTQLHLWLLSVALLFTIGGLLFWFILLGRVIQPLHMLATHHQALSPSEQSIPLHTTILATREDEVGDLARSLIRLEHDGLTKLTKLRTLLETSNAVVGSLEPQAVVGKIIREVRRLVDVQAAAVLLPDEQSVLHVLISDGHSQGYDQMLSLSPENVNSSAVLAWRGGMPVQKILSHDQAVPSLSYDEGFRSVLAIPIISRHVGGVVLLVHRTEPLPFNQNEIDLLLTFANYATLAWEHAVLYERSDERLREVAQENERLYRHASEEKHKLEAIMGSMNDGLVLTGVDGRILYANAGTSAIVGLPSEALVQLPVSTLNEALLAAAVDVTEGKRHLEQLERNHATEVVIEGSRRVVHLRRFDVRDEFDQALGRGLLLRDITREHELDEFKTTLLAAVGHEVRTPLAVIKGYASTLLQEDVAWPLEDQHHFLRMISSKADAMAQLVSHLLDLSRQEAGLLLLKREPASLQRLITSVREQISHVGTTIEVNLPADLPIVNVDHARIEVVLHNLITNALAYGQGHVSIIASRQTERIVVSVANNGSGITPEELPHVFERFFRAHHGRQAHAGGTGLGLAICKAFIEAHDGAIWAESTERGTSISFTLPLALPITTTTYPPTGINSQD